MNKKDFVKIIRDNTGSTFEQAEIAFNQLTDSIHDSLVAGDTVNINNVGSLSTFTRKARNYHLPGGQVVTKGDRTDVKFKDFSELKQALNS